MSADAQDFFVGLDMPDLRPEIREELHDAWTAARDESLLAYREWSAAREDDLELGYFAYIAAADREAAAARHLQRNCDGIPQGNGSADSIEFTLKPDEDRRARST
jgi:hypothetical protein